MAANETKISGITTNALTGERHIPASVRADGSQRREIRIRPGYSPPEDVELYRNRAAASWKNRGKAGIPGAEPAVNEDTASSTKNPKKKDAKSKVKASSEGVSQKIGKGTALDKDNWRLAASKNTAGGPKQKEEPEVDPEVEREKKARNLKKKLKQARELRDKKDKGESLLPEQLEKIIRINELVRQLESLGIEADDEKKVDPAESK
ncbi:hypothetical protein MGYG_08796 [Nannizzia gypsea CBS 118893]|uniref:WIBG Mago-binding domain-containing protein n=1 Tax=Arthroderma gypseum (strain ATCC MYA-4604 / CBS 118893) TaxID=535722 RepID=E4V708_ARTGP|nr:hypothetical protein MGYG_08796 [Nannizzia gypsea CBS 118893]EFQ96874.1 hypothetical protein MGYG_08796 [Nannizzia gypsea CBS 118893]